MDPEQIRRHFNSPWRLIESANKHHSSLKSSYQEWRAQEPFKKWIEPDPESGMKIYKLRLQNELPGDIATLTYDIANNLRSALDHAVYASAICFGATKPRKANFPFDETAEGVDLTLAKGKSKNAPADIKPLLRSFKPYKTGNSMLWALNKMRNTSTHAVLVEPAIFANGVQAFPLMSSGGTVSDTPYEMILRSGEWDAEKREIEILRITEGDHPPFNVKVTPAISVSDVEILRGKSIWDVFGEMGPMVHDIVGNIEAETIRLLK